VLLERAFRDKPHNREEVENMMSNSKAWMLILGVCIVFLSNVIAPPRGDAAEQIIVTGTVWEDEWDDNNNVTAVVIEADDGEQFLVSNEGKGKELLTLAGKNVKVTGVVGEEVDGWKTITVTAYAVIE